jgi:hypothetical protein
MMRKTKLILGLAAAALLAVGCANQKEPAMQAIASAESALNAIKDDATKYLPGDLGTVEATLSGLKDAAAKGDYKAVIAGAPALMTSLGSLKDMVGAKKSEMEAAMAAAASEWTGLSADLPKMVEAISSRVGILSSAKKLPKNLDQASFDSAKSGLEMMKSTWTEASSAFASGNAIDAVAKAKMVKDKGAEVMQLLGMTTG